MQTTLRILWTKREGTRRIRRTIVVLAAGIIQIHGLRGNWRIGFFTGVVMTHRRIAGRGRYRAEALLNKSRLLLAKFQLLCLGFQFGDRIASRFAQRDFMGQPGKEVNPGCAILFMAFPIARQFNVIFVGFHQGDGIRGP